MSYSCVKLSTFKRDKSQRKIFDAKCPNCGTYFTNHRSFYNHKKICKGKMIAYKYSALNFISPIPNITMLPHLSKFDIDLIEMMISSNTSINMLNNNDDIKIFVHLGVHKSKIPTPSQFRQNIIHYGHIIYNNTMRLFENKTVSIILDGVTSWNRNFYQFSIFHPNLIRHYNLIQIKTADSITIKNIILNICEDLKKHKITVAGITTDNASNLVSSFKKIRADVISNLCKFPIIRFSCAAHTAQLLIDDLNKNFPSFKKTVDDITSFLSWLRTKNILNQFKNKGLQCSPPHFKITRWNSLYRCTKYILNNFDFFKNTKIQLSKKNSIRPIQFDEELNEKLSSLFAILGPILKFTNIVQQNFSSIGDAFCALCELKTDLTKIQDNDKYGYIKFLLLNINHRFGETCDSILAEIGFLLTQEGKEWWNNKKIIAEKINSDLSEFIHVSEEDFLYLSEYNSEKKSLLRKIKDLSLYFKIDVNYNTNAFLAWLDSDETYIGSPIEYWKSNFTNTFIYNNQPISLLEFASLAIRILVIPASEAIAERCFSQLKLIHSHLRSQLGSELLDAILRIKLNLIWEKKENFILNQSDDEYDYSEISSDSSDEESSK